MSDQVIRYESKEQYIEFRNHLRYLATGEVVDFPDWGEDPDAYWDVFYKRMKEDPEQVFEMWTLLEDEEIAEDGSLVQQHVRYETLRYPNKEESRKSQEKVFIGTRPDPGTPASPEFDSLRQAERMRSALMKLEPNSWFYIKHRTACSVIDSPVTVP